MAEDTCKNGRHPASDVYVYPNGRKRQCRSCKRESTRRYITSPKGKVTKARVSHRYEMSLKGYLRRRERYCRDRRAEIVRELAALEEERCLM